MNLLGTVAIVVNAGLGLCFVAITIHSLKGLREVSRRTFLMFCIMALVTPLMFVTTTALATHVPNPRFLVYSSLLYGIIIACAFVGQGFAAYRAGLEQGRRASEGHGS